MQIKIKELKDISYLGEAREEKMDAYLPGGCTSDLRPAVLLIHGGGWRLSDKASAREVSIARDLAHHGYAVFSINYLLNIGDYNEDGVFKHTRIAWPNNFFDCKSALRFVRKFAHRYQVDSSRIAVMGASAGAHLAMLLASTSHHDAFNSQGLYTEQSSEVSCVLNFYGDYDVRGRRVSPFQGANEAQTQENEQAASPVTWIDDKTPPMLIAHGVLDDTVLIERSRLLVEHLRKQSLTYVYLELSEDGHGFNLHPKSMDLEMVVVQFLNKFLN
ncbi:alpha/beta hydrolase [Coraliomargarita algicola]|uniref:Alpha/beta hydrolase n=1 Tax=Coraliomargarita algicola TaxID=3092156 RepID=A0ABZ0RIV9_9BACT|nr:alpha/beta hydrolase [Coraliomargarita sp. J2-16]WPJ96134.1 alpha/beta hydrolase [Coraliomargarita sp. J2-16]